MKLTVLSVGLVIVLLSISLSARGTNKSPGIVINNAPSITLTPTYLPEKIGTIDKPIVITSKKDFFDYAVSLFSGVALLGTVFAALAAAKSAIAAEKSAQSTSLQALITLRMSYEKEVDKLHQMIERPLHESGDSTKILDKIEGEIKKYNAFIRKCDDEIAKLEKKLIPDSVF